MASSFADLRRRAQAKGGPDGHQFRALSRREATIRQLGELLAGFGLLSLIVALQIWSSASGSSFTGRNIIQIPDDLVPYVTVIGKPFQFAAVEMLVPYGQYVLAAFIAMVTFGAVIRRRIWLCWCILAICLFPWSLLSIAMPGLSLSGAALLVYFLTAAVRRKDYRHTAVYAVLLLINLGIIGVPDFSGAHTKKQTSGIRVASLLHSKTGLSSFETLKVPVVLETAKAYAYAQELFLSHDDKKLAGVISQIPEQAFPEGSLEAKRMTYMRRHLGDLNLLTSSEGWIELHFLSLQRYAALFFALLSAFAIILGEGLEYISGRILRRSDRIGSLKEDLQNETLAVASVPTTESRLNEALHRIKVRAYMVLGLTAVLTACAMFTVGLSIWWAPASDNHAFSAVHLLHDVAEDMQANGISIQTDVDPFSGFIDGKLIKWVTLGTIIVAGLFAILQNPRAVRDVLAGGGLIVISVFIRIPIATLASLVFMKSRERVRRLAGCSLLFLSLSVSGISYFGTMHAGKIEVPATEIQTAVEHIYSSKMASRSQGGGQSLRLVAGYRYALAQVAYLNNDPVTTKKHVHWIYSNSVPASDLARQRLAVVRQWLLTNGDAADGPGTNDTYVLIFGALAELSHWALLLSRLFVALAAAAALLSIVLFVRLRRISDMVAEYFKQSTHVRVVRGT